MIEKIKNLVSRKSFHSCIIIIVIAVILFGVGITMLKYSVEGETNMPFNLNKITIITSAQGVDKENNEESKWAFDINQNSDVYLYIQKNQNFKDVEAIKSVLIDNIKIEKENEIGTFGIYRPNVLETGTTFNNLDENRVEAIEYEGDLETNLKTLKISNQGGVISFRCANNKIAEYMSNEEEINHAELLKKAGITDEVVKGKLSFDLTIKVVSGKEFKTTIFVDIPTEGLIQNGMASTEITDLKEFIFKRIKN